MNIVLVSNLCSNNKFKYIQENKIVKSLVSSQSFFNSIVEGLKNIPGCKVTCISVLPITCANSINKDYRYEYENCDGINYYYLPISSLPYIRSFIDSVLLKRTLKKILKKENDDSIIVFDSLMFETTNTIKYAKKKGIPTIGCLTDVPDKLEEMINSSGIYAFIDKLYYKIATNNLPLFDSYIFMTSEMNTYCNKSNKPYILIDCIVKPFERKEKKMVNKKPVVLYAGKLIEKFGVLNLAKSAEYLENICDIWLYGSNCDCKKEIEELCSKHSNLYVHDAVDRETILQLEKDCNILINPRFSDDFTRYSFPSKTAEYMLSETPVLMYKLPCLNKEYDDYLYYINGNDPLSIANSIKKVLSIDKSKLEITAKKAREFILNNKNNDYQSEKIYGLAKTLLNQKD